MTEWTGQKLQVMQLIVLTAVFTRFRIINATDIYSLKNVLILPWSLSFVFNHVKMSLLTPLSNALLHMSVTASLLSCSWDLCFAYFSKLLITIFTFRIRMYLCIKAGRGNGYTFRYHFFKLPWEMIWKVPIIMIISNQLSNDKCWRYWSFQELLHIFVIL